jgi:predicted transcriptional regulator
MSTESLNRTSNDIETPNINIDVLNQNKRSKKICIHTLNKRLISSKKKEKFKNLVIVSSVLLSVGVMSFIIT